ncbi:hypothetical protein TcCL_ESM09648 [Trypanosoma cruzi]|nr:hypothetical protein TcCL_ESM09648 [Trypanosoma cruzi]
MCGLSFPSARFLSAWFHKLLLRGDGALVVPHREFVSFADVFLAPYPRETILVVATQELGIVWLLRRFSLRQPTHRVCIFWRRVCWKPCRVNAMRPRATVQAVVVVRPFWRLRNSSVCGCIGGLHGLQR